MRCGERRLADIQDRVNAATEGPWHRRIGRIGNGTPRSQEEQVCADNGVAVLIAEHDGLPDGDANMAFVAHSWEDVQDLIADLRDARAAVLAERARCSRIARDAAAHPGYTGQHGTDLAVMVAERIEAGPEQPPSAPGPMPFHIFSPVARFMSVRGDVEVEVSSDGNGQAVLDIRDFDNPYDPAARHLALNFGSAGGVAAALHQAVGLPPPWKDTRKTTCVEEPNGNLTMRSPIVDGDYIEFSVLAGTDAAEKMRERCALSGITITKRSAT